MGKAKVDPSVELDRRMDILHGGMCGMLSRVVDVLAIPWQHEAGKAALECQMKALDKWLTRKQHGYSLDNLTRLVKEDGEITNEIDGVEVPFG